jgi:hypothetical protein
MYKSGLVPNTEDPLLSTKEEIQSVTTEQNQSEFAGASALLYLAEGSNMNKTSYFDQAPPCTRAETTIANPTGSSPGYIGSGTSAQDLEANYQFDALASTIPTFAADQTRQDLLRPALFRTFSNISSSLLVCPSLSTTRILRDPVVSAAFQMQYQSVSNIELLTLYESLIRLEDDASRSFERGVQQLQGRHAQSNYVVQ